MEKYKKRSKASKLYSMKNQKSGKKAAPDKALSSKRAKESLDMLTIPEELSSRGISTRRIGRMSKRSNYQQAMNADMDFPDSTKLSN